MTTLTYIAIGPYCWGKADTEAKAVANAKRNWPRSCGKPHIDGMAVYSSTDPGVYVNDMGGLCHKRGAEVKRIREPKAR